MPGKLAAMVRAQHPGVYDDMDDAALESAVLAKYPQYADLAEETNEPAGPEEPGRAAVAPSSDPQGSTLSAIGLRAAPIIENVAARFATSPSVPKTAATIGRVVGGVAAPVGGAIAGGPVGALLGALGASKGAWMGGRTGWHTGKLLQSMAAPVANTLGRLAPLGEAMSPMPIYQRLGEIMQDEEMRSSQPSPPQSPVPLPGSWNQSLAVPSAPDEETLKFLISKLTGR